MSQRSNVYAKAVLCYHAVLTFLETHKNYCAFDFDRKPTNTLILPNPPHEIQSQTSGLLGYKASDTQTRITGTPPPPFPLPLVILYVSR